jgi:predicted RNase H-like nuclease (RuvC/YqgF family)
MKNSFAKNHFLLLLLPTLCFGIVADEGGGTPPIEGQVTPPVEPAAKPPGRVAQVLASLKDKATLNAQINTQSSRIADLEAQVIALTESNQVLTVENGELTKDFAAIDSALKTTQAQVVAVDKLAAAKIVDAGFSSQSLPAAVAGDEETIESLEEKLAIEKDPKERFRLQTQINKLEATV